MQTPLTAIRVGKGTSLTLTIHILQVSNINSDSRLQEKKKLRFRDEVDIFYAITLYVLILRP